MGIFRTLSPQPPSKNVHLKKFMECLKKKKTDHILGHEPSLNTFCETGIIPTAFSDNNKIFKLDSKTK